MAVPLARRQKRRAAPPRRRAREEASAPAGGAEAEPGSRYDTMLRLPRRRAACPLPVCVLSRPASAPPAPPLARGACAVVRAAPGSARQCSATVTPPQMITWRQTQSPATLPASISELPCERARQARARWRRSSRWQVAQQQQAPPPSPQKSRARTARLKPPAEPPSAQSKGRGVRPQLTRRHVSGGSGRRHARQAPSYAHAGTAFAHGTVTRSGEEAVWSAQRRAGMFSAVSAIFARQGRR